MRQLDARLSRLEQRLSGNQPPRPSLDVSVEEAVREFNRIAEAVQECQPGASVEWLHLPEARRCAVIAYLAGREDDEVSLEEIRAAKEIIRIEMWRRHVRS